VFIQICFLVKHSKCRADFLNRVKLSEQLKRTAKESGKSVPLASIKRQVRFRYYVFELFLYDLIFFFLLVTRSTKTTLGPNRKQQTTNCRTNSLSIRGLKESFCCYLVLFFFDHVSINREEEKERKSIRIKIKHQ
jgi:hypothetical protein